MQKFKNDRKNVDKILEAMVTGGISVWRGAWNWLCDISKRESKFLRAAHRSAFKTFYFYQVKIHYP